MSQSLELIRIIHCACLFDYTEESGRKLRIFNDKEAHHFEKSGGQLRQLMVHEITLNEKNIPQTFDRGGWRHNQTSQSLPIPQPRPKGLFVFQNGGSSDSSV